jgi:simple sugar transport system permease protein
MTAASEAATRATRWLTDERQRIVLALAGALLVLNLSSFAFGQAPLATLSVAWAGTWGTPYGIGQVLFKATPLMFTGMAFHVALRAGLFNIGSEGQLVAASLAATWLATRLPANTPSAWAIPAALWAAVVAGAALASIAGAMRAYLGVHEIISTIMLNRIADALATWLMTMGLGESGVRTKSVVRGARITALGEWIGVLRGSAASLAFPFAVLVVFQLHWWLRKSRAGREMVWLAEGAPACEAHGIDVKARRLQAMALSGALAGLAVAGTVLGYKGYYELGLGAGAGFSGIAVAMVGRGGPVQLIVAALLFGTLAQAGLAINARVPRDAMGVIEAVVILLMGAAAFARTRSRGEAR